MTLNPHPTYPAAGGYVLRLHRDTKAAAGVLVGRVEHVASGEAMEFASGAELLDWLVAHAAKGPPATAAVGVAKPPHDQGVQR